MHIPPGTRHELLSPFDPRQQPGRTPRTYPLHLMECGDWFAIENCPPQRVASIRQSIIHFRKVGHPDRRFTVRRCPSLGVGTIICARIA